MDARSCEPDLCWPVSGPSETGGPSGPAPVWLAFSSGSIAGAELLLTVGAGRFARRDRQIRAAGDVAQECFSSLNWGAGEDQVLVRSRASNLSPRRAAGGSDCWAPGVLGYQPRFQLVVACHARKRSGEGKHRVLAAFPASGGEGATWLPSRFLRTTRRLPVPAAGEQCTSA